MNWHSVVVTSIRMMKLQIMHFEFANKRFESASLSLLRVSLSVMNNRTEQNRTHILF